MASIKRNRKPSVDNCTKNNLIENLIKYFKNGAIWLPKESPKRQYINLENGIDKAQRYGCRNGHLGIRKDRNKAQKLAACKLMCI